jgi:alpha-L-fucosidase 2
MKKLSILWLLLVTGLVSHGTGAEMSLWYNKPATNWQKEALPIGSGSLGAMIFGDSAREHIQFNEDTLWIGDEQDTGAYQNFGDLYVALGHENPAAYRRELDISRAIQTIQYRHNGVQYTRRYFASTPAGVMVFHFTADRKGAYTGTVSLVDAHKATVTAAENRLQAAGTLEGYVYRGGSSSDKEDLTCDIVLSYEAQLLVLHEGGALKAQDGQIALDGVDSFTLLLAAGTDYLNQRDRGWKGPHPHKRITARLEAASAKGFSQLRREHVRDYRGLFDRVTVNLGETPQARRQLPTDERLAAYKAKQPDPDLEELLFQYARYLMISSSRPGTLPANLQGVWNQSNRPPWRCDYHTDVNIQMNYWFVDQANLSECFGPLAEWFNSIRGVRKDETKAAFNTRGWITHAENGIFGGSTWKWSKGDAAWVAQNLWDHYAFTRDETYLRSRAYPIMKELCAFWQDNLKALDDGTLVSPDGFSPEHGPTEDGVSFDQQLVWDLFTNTIEASQTLGVDEALREKLTSMKARLLGPKIGKWGQLQEWMVDRDDPKDQHRHLSHLIAVHPGRQISPLTTPALAEAAKVSMNARGDGATGWSKAWKINIWARLHDGDRAYKLLSEQIRGNYYDNLFGYHPPFQIDGNFGYASGVCEMLVQSHMGKIHLLPALPKAWADGQVTGLRARGGYELDLTWKSNRLVQVAVRGVSNEAVPCRIVVGTYSNTLTLDRGARVILDGSLEPVQTTK